MCLSAGLWLLFVLVKRRGPSPPPTNPSTHIDHHLLLFFCFFLFEMDGSTAGFHPWSAYLDNLAGFIFNHCSKQFFCQQNMVKWLHTEKV